MNKFIHNIWLASSVTLAAIFALLSSFAVTASNEEEYKSYEQGYGSYEGKLRRANHLKIVDANGRTVGRSVGILKKGNPPYPLVAFRVKGHQIIVGVETDQFTSIAPQSSILYFESFDCTGTPLFVVPPDVEKTILPVAAISHPGNTVYVPDTSAIPQVFHVNSSRLYLEPCNNFPNPNYYLNVLPAIPLIDLDTKFTPPFRETVK